MTTEHLMFYALAVVAIASAISMILQRNPVMSAISLIGNFFCLAALYLLLRAQLLAVLQIVVYTGAIMVLVVFVIMLLNLGKDENLGERFSVKTTVAVALACGLLLELVYIAIIGGNGVPMDAVRGSAEHVGTVESMGMAMFGRFLLPFEFTSLLLLAAIVGAVILAKRRV